MASITERNPSEPPHPLASLHEIEENTDTDKLTSKIKSSGPNRGSINNTKVAADAEDDVAEAKVSKPESLLPDQIAKDKLPVLMWWERLTLFVVFLAVGAYLIFKFAVINKGNFFCMHSCQRNTPISTQLSDISMNRKFTNLVIHTCGNNPTESSTLIAWSVFRTMNFRLTKISFCDKQWFRERQ
jgi:hypothetical protein